MLCRGRQMEHLTESQQWDQTLLTYTPTARGNTWLLVALCLLAVPGLLFLSRENYLLYHGIVEILSVVVAITIFSIGWNARHFVQDNTLLVLAVAYLPIGALDFLHILSYKGMGVFPDNGANLATQLWIAARYLESVALFGAALLLGTEYRLNQNALLKGCILIATLLCGTIALNLFPACFVEGSGLTTFKVVSEYFISGLLILAALVFWNKRQFLNSKISALIITSIAITIASELSFTLYVDVYGLFNFVGHVFKLISVVLIYLALVQGSLVSPYQSLFRKLSMELEQRSKSEEELRTVNRELDTFVYTVSHDLRAPLTPIIGYADYLHEKDGKNLDSESSALLLKIGDLGRGMTGTMEDLLTLVKVGRLEIAEKSVNTAEVVDDVLLTLSAPLLETNQTIQKEPLPNVKLPESLLRQLFSNLISNALRYGVSSKTIKVGGQRQDNLVRFYVQDHGPGIPINERECIFDLFYRGAKGNRTQGSGAGLAIVKKITNLYRGKSWVEETPGGGATFWVELEEPTTELKS